MGPLAVDGDPDAGGGGQHWTGRGGDLPRRGCGKDVLAQCDVRSGDRVGQSVLDHGLGPLGGLLTGLEEGDVRPAPRVRRLGQDGRRPEPGGDVEVVAAGVHHAGDLGPVGQVGGLLDRQGVDVRAEKDGRPGAVLEHSDDAAPDLPDAVAEGLQPPRDLRGGLRLLHRQLGVSVQVGVELLLPRCGSVEPADYCVRRAHVPPWSHRSRAVG